MRWRPRLPRREVRGDGCVRSEAWRCAAADGPGGEGPRPRCPLVAPSSLTRSSGPRPPPGGRQRPAPGPFVADRRALLSLRGRGGHPTVPRDSEGASGAGPSLRSSLFWRVAVELLQWPLPPPLPARFLKLRVVLFLSPGTLHLVTLKQKSRIYLLWERNDICVYLAHPLSGRAVE